MRRDTEGRDERGASARECTPPSSCRLAVLDEPIHGDIDVDRIFGGDRVAADLAVGERLQLQPLDQLVYAYGCTKIILVAQDQRRDALERRLGEQVMQLALEVAMLSASAESTTYTIACTPRQ